MFDLEKIIFRIIWKKKQPSYADLPSFTLEASPSSSQKDDIYGPGTIARVPEYSLETFALASSIIKNKAESADSYFPSLHPTPEVEEVKEVEILQSFLQTNITTSIQHTPIIPQPIHPQNLPPPPLMAVPGFLLNKYATLALPQVLNDMPQDYLKLLPRFTMEDSISAQRH